MRGEEREGGRGADLHPAGLAVDRGGDDVRCEALEHWQEVLQVTAGVPLRDAQPGDVRLGWVLLDR